MLRALFESKPDAPVVIPYHYSEFSLATSDADIVARVREFTFSRDLFSMSSPLRSELYFYGRSDIINEISAMLAAGENFGLFGLRRSGKTSLISGISRALATRNGTSVTIDCQSPSVHQLRWNELLRHIAVELKSAFSVKHKIGSAEADLPPEAPSFITRVYGSGFHILRRRIGQARRARSPQTAQASGALLRVFGCRAKSAA